VLGGAQSLHTNGMDEAFAIPTEEAMKIALRTQQIIAHETRVADVADPLGGSYFVESLTSEYEKAIVAILDEVDARGGTIKLIEEGWFQRQISDFAYEVAIKKQEGEHPVIGVNCFVEDEEKHDIDLHPYDPSTADRQIARLKHVRTTRDQKRIESLLEKLKQIARDEEQNIMPVTIELVREGASMGDIVETLKTVWGTYREPPVF
jgi:methylmalonyl-CoA mutase N-terminal domain/subunit